jgi:plasmid stabilization system protein ParE
VRLEFHPEATAELEQSAQWYAERSLTAAEGFVAAVETAIRNIVDTPNRFLKIGHDCRACSLVGYPFQVVFRRVSPRIQIVAVAHAKRRPGYWKNRRFGKT